ncbi:MAG: hypothetical protein NTY32_04675 [Bacteroidia bacterium]|nr:hypothetical protein [Bacteroidia bacterium]
MNLVIADYTIRLFSDTSIYMDEGYAPFLKEVKDRTPDMEVECISGIPVHLFDGCETLFEAKNDSQRFYSVVKYGTGLGFKLYNQQTIDEIQQLAVLDVTYKHWKIYSEPTEDHQLHPMKYPMGPIMLYYLVVNNDAIMIHASGVFDGAKGRIFTGFSGTGKSTMAEQWKSCGSSIVNDDRMIIRKGTDGFYMHNTPMYYFDLPKSAPVHAIHLIRHFPENITQRITGAKAVSKVMAFCIQNNFDKQFIQNYIGFITELCAVVGIYETGFVPDHSIVRYLQTHEE